VHRESIKSAGRIVVKLGTGVLTDSHKLIDPAQLEQLVAQVAALKKSGKEIVLVTSGAVGAGMGALGYPRKGIDLKLVGGDADQGVLLIRTPKPAVGSSALMLATSFFGKPTQLPTSVISMTMLGKSSTSTPR